MRLATYNPDQGRRELGLGLGLIAPPWQRAGTDEAILDTLFSRSKMFLRDGSITYTGSAVLRQNPATGGVKTGALDYYHTLPCGLVLPMRYAGQAWANLCIGMTGSDGLALNTLSQLSRTIVEAATTNIHDCYGSGILVSDATTYTIRTVISRGAGNRHAALYLVAGANKAGYYVDLAAGTIGGAIQGGAATASGGSVVALGSGRYRLSFQVSATAWGALAAMVGATTNVTSGASGPPGHTGDGVSSVIFEAVTLVAGTITPPGIAEGGTAAAERSTQVVSIVPPVEVVAIFAPIGWSLAAGVSPPHAGGFFVPSGNNTSYAGGRSNNDIAAWADQVTQRNAQFGGLALTENTLAYRSTRLDASTLFGYRAGAEMATAPVVSAPWVSHSTWDTGSLGVGYQPNAFCTTIIVPGGMTASERAALSRQVTGAVIRRVA